MISESGISGTMDEIILKVKNHPEILHHFTRISPDGKCVGLKDLWETNTHILDLVTNTTYKIFENIENTRLIDIVTYDPENKAYNMLSTRQLQGQFLSSKLYWLCNDIKINGLGYPPQGFLHPEKGYTCHPGTYRYYASYVQQSNGLAFVWDTLDKFKKPKLNIEEWVSFCSTGKIRNHSVIEIKQNDALKENQLKESNVLEIHFQLNHHDHCIFNYDRALAEIYNKDKPTIYYTDKEILEHNKSNMKNPDAYKYKFIHNKFLIPSNENFKGVSMYLNKKYKKDLTLLFLYLDINDDVAYSSDRNTIIFNNSSINCKNLIPQIVEESDSNYLNDMHWSNKKSLMPLGIEGEL